MPDLLLVAPQSAPVKNPAANSASAAEAPARNGDSSKAGTESPSEASFANTLKTQMDKHSGGEGGKAKDSIEDTSAQGAAIAETPATTSPAPTDIAALLPLIEAALAGKLPGQKSADKSATADGTDAAPQTLTATTTTDAKPEPLPTAVLPTTPQADTQAQAAKGMVKEEQHNAPPAAVLPRTTANPGAGEKLAAETAIAAEGATSRHEQAQAALPHDFQALVDQAAAAMHHSANAAAPTPASATSLQVSTPLGQAGWHEEVGQKLVWMVGGNKQQAELVLTPPQLGRIEVSLTVTGDQATATFASANPAVREALENSVHRLREVLADAGVTLGQANVGAETFRQPGSSQENGDNRGFTQRGSERLGDVAGLAIPAPALRSTAGRGMVDVFA